jgi:hypothetical protein
MKQSHRKPFLNLFTEEYIVVLVYFITLHIIVTFVDVYGSCKYFCSFQALHLWRK